jgi:hypothetical protein
MDYRGLKALGHAVTAHHGQLRRKNSLGIGEGACRV